MYKNYINIYYKILIITSLYFFASYNSFASNSDFHTYKQVVDSSISFLWNTTDEDWDYCSFYNYKYDNLGNRIEYLRKYYELNNNQWQNETKNIISYNNYENIYNLVLQKWDTLNNIWKNSSHDTIYFDDAGKEIYEKFFQWDTLYNTWANKNYKISLYSNNQLSSDTIKNWDSVSNNWLNNKYYDYTYEPNLMNVTSFLWDTTINEWINNEKKVISYNYAGEETGLTAKQWDTTSNDWINNYQYTLIYDSENKKIEYRFQINDTTTHAWINCYRDTLIYDEYGNDSVFLSQIWDEETTFWINKSKSINSFDKKKNITKQTSFNWNNETEIWDNYSKIEYFLSEIECHLAASITESSSILCFGDNSGTATITASGGIQPFFYQWDDNLTTTSPTVDNLSANIYYHVVVTDSVQCEATDSIKLSQPDELLINFSYSTNVSCYGFNDGNATINVTGGTEPYIYQWDNAENSTTSSVSRLEANIFYHISVTDNNGCTKVDSIMLSEPNKVITSTISGPTNAFKDDIAVYSISETINSVYSWNVYGGEILNGQGTDSISVNWQIVGMNKISILETADNGCNGDTVKLNVSVGTNDITNINNCKHVVVYPNPFKNFTTIYLPKDKKYYRIDVIDIQGRMVKSFHKISKNKISLSAEGLNSGFYYLKILSDNIIYTKKIVRN
ncbi:MAG: T9SS type A sorting domain-containing protein [Bacteroidetes bacterium]|nr:T9SS type A sorting domain-containing protein [Bacteroidota bacterium]